MTTSEVAHWRYRNSSNNDLSYWGLDYPPLSGYQVTDTLSPSLNLWNHITQSWLHGKAIQHLQYEEDTNILECIDRGQRSFLFASMWTANLFRPHPRIR